MSGQNLNAHFGASRFRSDIVYLKFADNVELAVHHAVLLRHSKLGGFVTTELCEIAPGSESDAAAGAYYDRMAIDFTAFSAPAGDTLAHYLYLDNYLLPRLSSAATDGESRLIDMKLRLEVYALARRTGLDILCNRVRDDIEITLLLVGLPLLRDAILDAYPKPRGPDPAFEDKIRVLTEEAEKSPSRIEELKRMLPSHIAGSTRELVYANSLPNFKHMLEEYWEAVERFLLSDKV